jgi:pyruvate kinase
MKKTKIIGTIGPITADSKSIQQLIDAGMNIVRLNGSHNIKQWHKKTIETVREVDPSVPILLDLTGRKVRTALNTPDIPFEKDDTIILTTESDDGVSENKATVNYPDLHNDLKAGDTILADDAQFRFVVEKIEGKDIFCKCQSKGVLKKGKGINVPYVKLNTPLVTEKDYDLIEFCIENKVDFVGVSFVESALHVNKIKELLKGSDIQVIAKVENQFALDNLDEILEAASGILIDRGDLGAETEIFNLSIKQKEIVGRANHYGKPVIVATEMLHTMITSPVPTKAEINDITNAVLDQCTAVMLSGESAVGEYPVEAVQTMTSVIEAAEAFADKGSQKVKQTFHENESSVSHAIGLAITQICEQKIVDKIVCVSLTGYSAQMISHFRPSQEILVATDNASTARKLGIYWGVTPFALDLKFDPEQTQHILDAVKHLYQNDVLKKADTVLITAVKYPKNSFMNFIEIHNVGKLAEMLSW